ncbi:hypothetical protein C1H46_019484 [Malus baccata]|uniref:Uncharacterized protein n=1 Tax=Malus baccata TaxID=106549 RepID=A0A540M8D7_MALBA|nr:hypothetical protein C1H46_019484 [Malus baccata]
MKHYNNMVTITLLGLSLIRANKMSNLISNRRAASRGSQTPSPGGSATTTSRPNMGTTSVPSIMPLGPTISTTPTSLTSSVTHPVLSA